MKIKAFVLIFLAVFATVAATTFMELSSSPIAEVSTDSSRPCKVVLVDNNETIDPLKEIDTPGMPG